MVWGCHAEECDWYLCFLWCRLGLYCRFCIRIVICVLGSVIGGRNASYG